METQQVVYITGGSKGIGKGIAQYLLDQGYKVAISSRKPEASRQAAESLKGDQENILALASDVRSLEDEQNAIQAILARWGRLDVLIANAGVGHFADITELTAEQWNQTIDTNLTGVFHSVKASLDEIKKNKGYIITISSLAGVNFSPKSSAYNASKFGLVGFTQALMLDVRQDDVKVTTIMPGSVTSHFNDHTPSGEDKWKIQPEDIGELVYDLLRMNPRALPSKVEIRPSKPPKK